VVFVDGQAKRSAYRKFKIETVTGVDDFASMQEVVERRYTRVLEEGEPLPDLIMVDGGKGQLSSAMEVLQKLGLSAVPIIGLAKRLEEVFLPEESEAVLLPRTSSGLRLLQRVRDEAHRFAITYHRSLREKRVLHSELEDIPGLGPKRIQALLEKFGSVEGIRAASLDDLSGVLGKAEAEKVQQALKGTAEQLPDDGEKENHSA
jgi:excinuclease ABC subunit C